MFAMGEPSTDLNSPLVRSNQRAVTGAFRFAESKASLTQKLLAWLLEHNWIAHADWGLHRRLECARRGDRWSGNQQCQRPCISPAGPDELDLAEAAEAATLGGHLATISDAEENAWIHQAFSVGNGCVWIALWRPPDGRFRWANGELATFRNWAQASRTTGLRLRKMSLIPVGVSYMLY